MALTKKSGAEFFGTFWLVLCSVGSKMRAMPNRENAYRQ